MHVRRWANIDDDGHRVLTTSVLQLGSGRYTTVHLKSCPPTVGGLFDTGGVVVNIMQIEAYSGIHIWRIPGVVQGSQVGLDQTWGVLHAQGSIYGGGQTPLRSRRGAHPPPAAVAPSLYRLTRPSNNALPGGNGGDGQENERQIKKGRMSLPGSPPNHLCGMFKPTFKGWHSGDGD